MLAEFGFDEHYLRSSRLHCFVDVGRAAALLKRAKDSGFHTIEVRFHANEDKDDALRNIARAMAFPSYFGNNWDALLDSLRDLEWLGDTSNVLMLQDIDVLGRDIASKLLSIFQTALQFWVETPSRLIVLLLVASCDDLPEATLVCSHKPF